MLSIDKFYYGHFVVCTQLIVFRQNQFSKMMVVGHHHYLVFLSFVCSGIAFALTGNHQSMQNDVECPKNWTKIGTGCYLFAIPEILATDNACKLDGKIFILHHLK